MARQKLPWTVGLGTGEMIGPQMQPLNSVLPILNTVLIFLSIHLQNARTKDEVMLIEIVFGLNEAMREAEGFKNGMLHHQRLLL